MGSSLFKSKSEGTKNWKFILCLQVYLLVYINLRERKGKKKPPAEDT